MKPTLTILLCALCVVFPADAAWWFHWPWKPPIHPTNPPVIVTPPVTNPPVILPTGRAVLTWDSKPYAVGYKIYWGGKSANYTNSMKVGDVSTFTLSNLVNKSTYFFAVTGIDSNGNESRFSNEASETTQ